MGPDATRHYRFGDLLALARLSWIRQVRARMEAAGYAGYRRTDASLLRILVHRPFAIGQLGDALGITRQAARQLADGLVARGYATLGADPADARRTLVVLTDSGEAYARAVWHAQDDLNDALRRMVSTADLVTADAVLRAVLTPDEAARVTERMPPPAGRGS